MPRRLRSLWTGHFLWWPLPAALAVIAAQQGLRRVGWTRLGDVAVTAGRLVWNVLVISWPLLIAAGIIVWQLRRRADADRQLQPDKDQQAPRRRPQRQRRLILGLSATAAALLALVAVLVVLPVLLVPVGAISDAKELYKARNDVRGTLVQVLAGGLVATGLVFTARTLDLNRSGQVTERFTRAVDQLSQRESGKLDLRLGGIYALERIARDSADDLPTVVDVLCVYVREYSPWPPRLLDQDRANLTPDELRELPDLQTRAPDLQAVLTVLGRLPDAPSSRPGRARAANPVHRVLTRTDLRRADLGAANLEGANLFEAHLERANLAGAHLEGANLGHAHLEGATLHRADLEGANLFEAHLERANLFEAHLERANLFHAYLERVILAGAHLEGANLREADLKRADLRANLNGANLFEADLEGANLRAANLKEANLRAANLKEANLRAADLEGATANAGTVWPSDFDWRAVGVLAEEDLDRG